jgi:hypothetical protein
MSKGKKHDANEPEQAAQISEAYRGDEVYICRRFVLFEYAYDFVECLVLWLSAGLGWYVVGRCCDPVRWLVWALIDPMEVTVLLVHITAVTTSMHRSGFLPAALVVVA